MKCLTWNLEWASPTSKRLGIIRNRIAEADPGVVCYTEVIRSIVPGEGYRIEADPDYGYGDKGQKRKVILWSKQPWTEFDEIGDARLPTGRYVSGITAGIRFIGVCIPWRDAHVKMGRKDRKPWEDHLSYCAGLKDIIERYSRFETPICVLGDYNQRIPRSTQPKRVFEALAEAIPSRFQIVTKGMKDGDEKSLIDHFAVSSNLSAVVKEIIPRFSDDGTRLSDHVGVLATLTNNNSEQGSGGNG